MRHLAETPQDDPPKGPQAPGEEAVGGESQYKPVRANPG